MAEPMFVYCEAPISRAAFKRWLELPLSSVEPDGERDGSRVKDFLASCLHNDQDHLMCRYDKASKSLQLAASLYDGSTADSKERAYKLAAIARTALALGRGKAQGQCIVAHLGELSEALPSWFAAWQEMHFELGAASSQDQWIDRDILEIIQLAQASPDQIMHIGWMYTDGEKVYAHVNGPAEQVDDPDHPGQMLWDFPHAVTYFLEGANPSTMRSLDRSHTFYTDGNTLWYWGKFENIAPMVVAHLNGSIPKYFFMMDWGIETLIVADNTAWNSTRPRDKNGNKIIQTTCIDGDTFKISDKQNGLFQDKNQSYYWCHDLGLCVVTQSPETLST